LKPILQAYGLNLSTPSLGITVEIEIDKIKVPQETFNSLSRDHKWLGLAGDDRKTSGMTFNSLSRDHRRFRSSERDLLF